MGLELERHVVELWMSHIFLSLCVLGQLICTKLYEILDSKGVQKYTLFLHIYISTTYIQRNWQNLTKKKKLSIRLIRWLKKNPGFASLTGSLSKLNGLRSIPHPPQTVWCKSKINQTERWKHNLLGRGNKPRKWWVITAAFFITGSCLPCTSNLDFPWHMETHLAAYQHSPLKHLETWP